MHIKLEDDDLNEIKPTDLLKKSLDKAIITNPGVRGNAIPDLVKEITAIDAIDNGATKAARMGGITQQSVSGYVNGKHLPEEIRNKVLLVRHKIQDIASTKLLDTINLIDPKEAIKTSDKIAMMTGLAKVVDTIGSEKEMPQQVHLHLYSPNQRKVEDYDVIDV